jgi:hypothetical protein
MHAFRMQLVDFFPSLICSTASWAYRSCSLEEDSVELVDEETLRTSVEFAGEKRALYEVLFSSDELIS